METTGTDPWNDELRLVQFGTETDAWALRWPLEATTLEHAFGRNRALVGWNSKFDEQVLRNNGLDPNFVDDAHKMAHLLFSEQSLRLKDFADAHLGADSSTAQHELKAIARKLKTPWYLLPAETYEYWYYGGMDTILTARAAGYCYPKLIERGYESLYDLELEVWHIIAKAEQRGMVVDREYCAEQLAKLEHDAKVIADRYPDTPLSGDGSQKALKKLLTDAGAVMPTTPKGNMKLDEKSLLASGHPIAADVLEYRGLIKNAHTYFRNYLQRSIKDSRVHCTMNTMAARTGRMSSSDPNLQNVPKREAGNYVRRAFMASPGCTLVFADFAQIEYRIFASVCGEEAMIQAFLDGKDMHAVTAELALGHEPTKHERDIGKNANFTELYLGGLEKFADTAGISMDQARMFKRRYHEAFPKIKPFSRSVIRQATANLFQVNTAFGRRCGVDAEKPYAAVNYGIQGTAADVMKNGLVKLEATRWGQYLVLTVHDEYVLDVPDELVSPCVEELPGILEDRTTFRVPLTVEISTSKRWGE